MYDFEQIHATSKKEQIRAWSIDKAIDSQGGEPATHEWLLTRAAKIEKFILEGEIETPTGKGSY